MVCDSLGPLRNRADSLKWSNADLSNILSEYFVTVYTEKNVNNITKHLLSGEVQALDNIHFLVNAVKE